jgi:predicted anti-sigma-YlaC factor YlaD
MHYNADTLDDYLHGALGPERDATIHAHLEACAPCRALYDEAATVRDWLRAAAKAEEREFPSMIKARVWEAVRNSPAPLSFADRLRALWRPMIAVPIAAAIAVFAYTGVPGVPGFRGNGQTAGMAATYLLEEHAALASDNPLADRGLIVPASVVDGRQTPALIDATETSADPSDR